jgi:hypothetical protein
MKIKEGRRGNFGRLLCLFRKDIDAVFVSKKDETSADPHGRQPTAFDA